MQLPTKTINKKRVWIIASFIIAVSAGYWLVPSSTHVCEDDNTTEVSIEPLIRYGIDVSRFIVKNHIVQPNEFFADILAGYNVAYSSIDYIARESKGIFNLNKIKAGNTYTVLCEQTDSGLVCRKLIYEENKTDFIVFNMDDSLFVYRGQKKVERKKCEVSGIIISSLYETLEQNNISPALAVRMADIFAWSIDFYRLQKGDRFKVIYEEDFVQGESIGIAHIHAVLFNSGGKDFYALYYAKEKNERGDYYDENGNNMKKMFLKAPVKFSRVSSRYTLQRFHPVTKVWKAHLGTDYAAPHGTPIMATADGVVEAATFNPNNGNYVKIRHNGQYKTQYLHMSKIAKGIRAGVRVKQGDIIGYVGSTGLATGPHVCYRFWKDGKQVDPLRQRLSYAEPLPAKYKSDFLDKTKDVKAALDAISYEQHNITLVKQKQEEQEIALHHAAAFVAKLF